jgi:hypothetical protein
MYINICFLQTKGAGLGDVSSVERLAIVATIGSACLTERMPLTASEPAVLSINSLYFPHTKERSNLAYAAAVAEAYSCQTLFL